MFWKIDTLRNSFELVDDSSLTHSPGRNAESTASQTGKQSELPSTTTEPKKIKLRLGLRPKPSSSPTEPKKIKLRLGLRPKPSSSPSSPSTPTHYPPPTPQEAGARHLIVQRYSLLLSDPTRQTELKTDIVKYKFACITDRMDLNTGRLFGTHESMNNFEKRTPKEMNLWRNTLHHWYRIGQRERVGAPDRKRIDNIPMCVLKMMWINDLVIRQKSDWARLKSLARLKGKQLAGFTRKGLLRAIRAHRPRLTIHCSR